MGIWEWLVKNGLTLSNIGVVASLLFTAISLRSQTKTRRVSNLLSVTANHRELWKVFLEQKNLERVRDESVNLGTRPVTEEEKVFVTMIVQHVHSVYRARNEHLLSTLEGLRRDIGQFFSLPIPKEVWEKIKPFQNQDFVEFVESSGRQ
jgi:hypothetical protein